MNPKNLKKSLLEPHKCQFGWGKTIGREKSQILTKNENLIFVYDFMLACVAPNPIFCNEFVRFYYSKKTTFWVRFGSILDPHVPRTLFFTMNFNDFTRFVFERQRSLKRPRGPPRWLQVAPSWSQIVPPDRHLFVCVRQKGFSFSSLKKPKGFLRP